MVSELPHEFRKFSRNCSHLRRILKETNRCLDEITSGEALLPLGGSLWRWIRIQYGLTSHIALTLGQQFEVVEHLHVNEKPWTTLPEDDLRRSECDERLWPEHSTVLEVQIFHPLMRDSVHVVIPPDCESLKPSLFIEMLHRNLNKSLPIFLYALEEDTLSEYNISELEKLNQVFPNIPVFFVCTSGSLPPPYPQELTESEQHQLQENKITYRQAVTDNKISMESDIEYIDKSLHSLLQRLTSLGYLNLKNLDLDKPRIKSQPYGQLSVSSEFIDGLHKLDKLQIFIRGCLQCHLVQAANTLNDIQGQCIQKVILSAFDMAREIQITPRRILYAQKKEGELYKNLMAISNEKQEEITQLIQVTLKDMKDNLVEKAGDYCYQGVTLSDSEEIKSAQSVHIATVEIQNWVLSWLSDSVASQLVKSVDCLQDTFVGTLQRCLESLEKNCQDQEGSLLASAAVKQILSAAYNVELTTSTSSSVLHSFIERLRKLLYGLQLPWTQAPRLDSEWRKRVATEMLNSLNAARLARSISAQFRDRVRSSHEAFQTAIHSLESHYTGHLVRTEEQRVAIRKLHAPRLARLSLESTSLSDMVQYGKLT
uniref:Uncharacterized protein n=1 Tax=Timema genevievae TaxID=629358 RepID=A0A7R9JZF0_TIMGE|nr:unnamed protein product [Timema genevievae]